MFGAELFDDFGARRRYVSQDARHTCLSNKAIDYRFRKTVGVGGKSLFENDARHLPMTGGCIFSV
jgi:hypothetical protein